MKQEPLYKSIQYKIQEKILDGTYKSGTKLMPENEMAEFYDVSRITIRNAMDNLVNGNFVERVRGKGTFVRDELDYSISDNKPAQITTEKKIALIIPSLDNIHSLRIFEGLYAEAELKNYSLTVYQTYHDQKREEKNISQCLKENVKGIIIYPVQKELYNEEIIKLAISRFPTVLVDRYLEGININSVVSDNEKASFNATRYLIEQGHKNIGIISPTLEMAIPLTERYRGFVRAHEESDMSVNNKFVFINNSDLNLNYKSNVESGIPGFEKFLAINREMTAIVCAEPLETKLLFYWAKKLGISIPGDLSFLCFDDFQYSELFAVPPTVVKQNSEEIGRSAFSILEKMINGEKNDFTTQQVEAELIVRDSVIKHK